MSTSLKRTSEEAGAEPTSIRSTNLLPSKRPRLKLQISQNPVSKKEEQTLKTRKAAAERWEPKLKRPFPKKREIQDSYSMKLMRHYPTNEPTPLEDLPVVRPHIPRSARVDKLLASLPLVPECTWSAESTGPLRRRRQTVRDELANQSLNINKSITGSDLAVRMAWHCFSSNENDRIDRGRQAMMVSGLVDADLSKEDKGVPNKLPEWKKTNTGKYGRCDSPSDLGAVWEEIMG
ncbi:hypothetical protein G6011_11665 [Alternaria panax]|uniref:Uncharacterized protein n=1 Tax=Alternaria panax TaxID=48097 RepID=A0AAD4IEG1_9PLEO|nr:hypothetical protein G6011_11665 [Alternaria panax]